MVILKGQENYNVYWYVLKQENYNVYWYVLKQENYNVYMVCFETRKL
jgi:hypothetical protein